MAGHGPNERNFDPGARRVLEELRDLRREMRADRLEMRADRRHADEERQRADEEWREERRRTDEERRRADAEWREERRQSDQRFDRIMRDFQQDAARREVATQKVIAATYRAFKDIRTVGLSIVKTLNHHTRILERIDRKLSARGDGRPGQDNGGARR